MNQVDATFLHDFPRYSQICLGGGGVHVGPNLIRRMEGNTARLVQHADGHLPVAQRLQRGRCLCFGLTKMFMLDPARLHKKHQEQSI